MQVTFINPAGAEDPFYQDMVALMELGARRLGLELEVVSCGRDLARMVEQAEALARRPRKPDAALVVNDRSCANTMIPTLSGAGIATLLVCEGLMLPDRQLLGGPRDIHASWVGELLPDDLDAGEQLARELLRAAAAAKLVAPDGRIHVAGLGGSYTSAAILRLTGLRRGLEADARAVLGHVAPAGWSRQTACKEMARLLEDDPHISVVWAANDAMALGALEVIADSGRAPGRDIVVGGIDWSPSGIREVKHGRCAVSVGGHFADGLWALVWIHQILHGRPGRSASLKSKMLALTPENVARYSPMLERTAWARLDLGRLLQQSEQDGSLRPGIEPLLALLDGA